MEFWLLITIEYLRFPPYHPDLNQLSLFGRVYKNMKKEKC